jgi:hypothetical protein
MTEIKRPVGRPRMHSDEEIIEAIRGGATTANELLAVLGLKHKTSLLDRLSSLADRGMIEITGGRGPHPYIMRLKEGE